MNGGGQRRRPGRSRPRCTDRDYCRCSPTTARTVDVINSPMLGSRSPKVSPRTFEGLECCLSCDHGDHRRETGRGSPVAGRARAPPAAPGAGRAAGPARARHGVGAPPEPLLDRAHRRGGQRRARVRDERRGRPLPRRAADLDLAGVPVERRVPGAARAGDARRPPRQPEHRVRDRDAGRADHRVGVRGRVRHAARGSAGDGRPPRADASCSAGSSR